MGVPLNTLLTFFVCHILSADTVSGLPFASISSIPSLKTLEPLPANELSSESSKVPISDNTENFVSSLVPGTLSSKSCQLFFGSPDVNINIFSSKTPSLLIGFNDEQIATADILKTDLFPTSNLQSNIVSSHTDPVSSCLTVTSSSLIDDKPDEATLTSGASIIPTVNIDFNSDNFKRAVRDTISVLEPCLTNANPNFASSLRTGFNQNYVTGSPFSSFPIPKPCLKMPVNLTPSDDQDCDISSNEVSTNFSPSNSVPCSSLLTNIGPSASLQNNIVSNPAFQPCLLPNRLNLPQNILSSGTESCEVINNSPSGSLFETLTSFADIRNYINSRQLNSGNIQNEPSIDTNICPCQVNQVDNNLMYAKALQNKITSEQSVSQANSPPICNNNVQNSQDSETTCSGLAAEYENILNIRNNVIPKLQLDNAVVKNIVQNNNDYSPGCPQPKTFAVEGNLPINQNNNLVLNPANNCFLASNNDNDLGNTEPTVSFNNIARLFKDNFNNNNAYGESNSKQGCPQLTSIPIYDRDSLQNRQIISFSNCDCSPNQNINLNVAQALLNNNMQFGSNNAVPNQNNLGCPELLTIAQNKLSSRNNCDTNVNVVTQDQNCNCLGETLENLQPENNCNAIQAFIPNDNLAQALKLINEAKLNQPVTCPAASINILPFGKTVIDGTPVCNNLLAFDSISGPVEFTCTDSSKSNNFFTIQDVSKPLPFVPVNPFPCCSSSEVPVNIPTNVVFTPTYSLLDNVSPFVTKIVPPVNNLSPSAPNIANIRPIKAPATQLFVNNQDVMCNSILPIVTLIDSNFNNRPANPTASPLFSPNFIPIQSLPQVSFVNSLPASTISVAPTVSLPDNFISAVSNLHSACNSIQPLCPSSYISPQITTNLPQASSVSGTSSVFPCLNNIVSALTQNIISTLKTKIPSASTPVALPPVNPLTLTETPSVTSPFCLDTVSNLPRSFPEIPVACNEYLPPLTLVPLTSFNSDLFCIESDETFDSCSPFSLSKTDAYYPELSFVVPSVPSSDCSCLSGPIYMPVSSLPQSSSVLKINNTGREAKCYEQFVKSVIL